MSYRDIFSDFLLKLLLEENIKWENGYVSSSASERIGGIWVGGKEPKKDSPLCQKYKIEEVIYQTY